MNEANTGFDWSLDEDAAWPPSGRPIPPFGPTALEVMRSCPLRACFEASTGYERRTGYAARMGTALHRTLQSLAEDPPAGKLDVEKVEEARLRFLKELEIQEEERAKRPRERGLPRDEIRISLAIEKVIEEALHVIRMGGSALPENVSGGTREARTFNREDDKSSSKEEQTLLVEVEVPVKSQDGLLYGRIDRAEHLPEGTHLVDYKSALRTDLPDRYERQLQLYALLWYETRGEWPKGGEVIYLLSGATYPISVEPEICQAVGAESRALISSLHRASPSDQLATPGDVCSVCEFRPWCKPFWRWQASETSLLAALRRAVLGFEGEIVSIEAKDFHWKVLLNWRNCTIRIIAPVERFPQLRNAKVGTRVRALEMRLHGQQAQPQAIVTELSELFLLR
jgi:PD-(D/E)XK nuclease superfamily